MSQKTFFKKIFRLFRYFIFISQFVCFMTDYLHISVVANNFWTMDLMFDKKWCKMIAQISFWSFYRANLFVNSYLKFFDKGVSLHAISPFIYILHEKPAITIAYVATKAVFKCLSVWDSNERCPCRTQYSCLY